jgi:hypothetical protein
MTLRFLRPALSTVAACSAMALAACGGPMIKPDSLKPPARIACIKLPEKLVFTSNQSGSISTTSLVAGLYISEKEDDGVYYRAPKGGVFINLYSVTSSNNDGGFWVPNDPSKPVRLYAYASPSAPPEDPSPYTECSNVSYVKSPTSQNISVSLAALEGAVGGASARSTAPGSQVSYGQAAAGGAIGMGIVAWIINSDAGKIGFLDRIFYDTAISEKLKALATKAVFIRETPQPSPAAENK